ncbi:xanthine dehydrogenase YagS FAD-binding subunit [Streptomyces sp. WMMB 714]|uniref:FAD binding domain-containing protein n=1 Tax=Streptomyces sp. WMMB 714 TaxID=1286822 RepID=UPI0005F78942|nr:xanthine dehydrogenase family protein subunit M [Streptomyces sp. WMMB 714]SCK46382.1 xanthine dehydrogenase YagS FAD-binding subunit [Streptomyces sp. WMMB 714]
MRPFAYVSARDVDAAVEAVAEHPGARFLGGGTNLVDLMREGVERPRTVVDISRLPLTAIEELPDGGLRIGALVRNSRLAADPLVRSRYPVLAQAVLNGASGQLRNMATVGGNLLQRTRCPYFYDTAARCNKREPGAGCDAMEGFSRSAAVLGTSEECIAAHPSDMCVALAALDAVVEVRSVRGARRLPFGELHRLPGGTPHIETALEGDELITAVELPPLPLAAHSRYRKVRDRASYAFALVSVAAALEVRDGAVADVRLALGGVGAKPWRAHEAEALLRGAPATEESFRRAADAEFAAAEGRSARTGMPDSRSAAESGGQGARAGNEFKIELGRRTVVAVLRRLADDEGSGA